MQTVASSGISKRAQAVTTRKGGPNMQTVAREAMGLVFKGRAESIEYHEKGGATLLFRDSNRVHTIHVPDELLPTEGLTPQSVLEIIARLGDRDGRDPTCVRLEVLSRAEQLPVDLENPDLTNTRFRHLHIGTPQLRAAAIFRHFLHKYLREYLEGLGFYHVHTPILTEASCVCSGDVFAFPYYNKKIANLIQSPWMYADALVAGVEKVYAINPSFRREIEPTDIHLVEIWQLQVDLNWATNDEIMDIEEGMNKYIAKNFLHKHGDLYQIGGLCADHLEALLLPYSRITYEESLTRLSAGRHFAKGNHGR